MSKALDALFGVGMEIFYVMHGCAEIRGYQDAVSGTILFPSKPLISRYAEIFIERRRWITGYRLQYCLFER